jgi:hypothetical protein
MNPQVAEYRALPPAKEGRPDAAVQERKVELIRALDDDANQAEVSALLLDLLRNASEFDLARAEAIEVVGLYIDESSPLWRELFGELLRIHADTAEDLTLQTAATQYSAFVAQALEG